MKRPPGRRGLILGRLLVTTCAQAQGAPIVDRATVHDAQGRRYGGRAIMLAPWRRNEYGDRRPGLAAVLAWRP